VAGTSAERLLVVLVVWERDEMDEMDEMDEDGVWVLWGGGGVENVSSLRSGSKGELDGEGEGVWTFIGNVKARGVGEMRLRIGLVDSGAATATSRAWMEVSGERWMDPGVLTLSRSVARADSGHDCSFVRCTRVRIREKVIVAVSGGRGEKVRDKKAVKARQARLAKKNAQYSRASAAGGRNGMLLETVQESSRWSFVLSGQRRTIVSGGNRIQLGAWPAL
jgi:hypothetical protein